MNALENVMLETQAIAFERGQRHGAMNRLEVESGKRGVYQRNQYASNPYPTGPEHDAYVTGWNSTGVFV